MGNITNFCFKHPITVDKEKLPTSLEMVASVPWFIFAKGKIKQ